MGERGFGSRRARVRVGVSRRVRRTVAVVTGSVVVLGVVGTPAPAAAAPGATRTYTTAADFAEGVMNNVAIDGDNVTLDDTTTAFPFMWIALSARGTIARIDTATGQIKGEYSTTSDGDNAHNPSRTTVGLDGSVWAGNRSQSSVIHVGLVEANQCVDRNGNGVIDTSTGYGDVRPWAGGTLRNTSPVSNARDECILHYVDTPGGDARHVSVDGNGDIWVGNWTGAGGGPSGSPHRFQKIDHATGTIVAGSQKDSACGGYGGLVDGNGVLWSASQSRLMRWDPALPASVPQCLAMPAPYGGGLAVYGLAFDSQNNIWVSSFNNTQSVFKVAASGSPIARYFDGVPLSQGLAVDGNDHVWMSSSLSSGANRIAHLKPDGSLVGHVTTCTVGTTPTCRGNGSTGVAVDADGKIWTANINSSDATRIDPNAGPLGPDGVTRVGAFDLRVALPGSSPYNYSDMTGATLTGAPNSGTWSVIYDSTLAGAQWGTVAWNATVPGDGSLAVTAASSTDGATFGPAEAVTSGADLAVADGRYLRIVVLFTRSTADADGDGFDDAPVLHDLTISTVNLNDPPVADAGGPYTVDEGSAVTVDGGSSSDPDGDALLYDWDLDNDGSYETAGATATFSAGGLDGPTSRVVGLRVCDTSNECSTDVATVLVSNVAPVVVVPSGTIVEGDTYAATGSFSDPGADTWTATVDYGDGSGPQPLPLHPDNTFTLAHVYADDNPTGTASDIYTVRVAVHDGADEGVGAASVTVTNADPVLGGVTLPVAPVALGSPVTASVDFTDVGSEDTHVAAWNWGDGTATTGPASTAGGAAASHVYATPGVYIVTATVTDDDGGAATAASAGYIVVYDPDGGFVTGGGWLQSPAGACQLNADCAAATGRASFGFVSRYHRGATVPSGNTEFQFHAGKVNFKSSSYEWLVVSGNKAQYKGAGTINGAGDYGFLLSARDGQQSGGSDTLRMKIWDRATGTVVYDNQGGGDLDEATDVIEGGNIVVHSSK